MIRCVHISKYIAHIFCCFCLFFFLNKRCIFCFNLSIYLADVHILFRLFRWVFKFFMEFFYTFFLTMNVRLENINVGVFFFLVYILKSCCKVIVKKSNFKLLMYD